MQARHTPRGAARLELVRGSDGPTSDERRPAGDAIVPADAGAAASPLGRLGFERDVAEPFRSILVPPGAARLDTETADEPEFFRDLNLDKVVAAITAGKDDYNLPPFFYSPIRDLVTIDYRQAVMRESQPRTS